MEVEALVLEQAERVRHIAICVLTYSMGILGFREVGVTIKCEKVQAPFLSAHECCVCDSLKLLLSINGLYVWVSKGKDVSMTDRSSQDNNTFWSFGLPTSMH